jgi:hypothetical protein
MVSSDTRCTLHTSMVCVLFAVPDDDTDSCTCSFTNNNWWQCQYSPTLTLRLCWWAVTIMTQAV